MDNYLLLNIFFNTESILGQLRFNKSMIEIISKINALNNFFNIDQCNWNAESFAEQIGEVFINSYKTYYSDKMEIFDFLELNNKVEFLKILFIETLNLNDIIQIQEFIDAYQGYPTAIINKKWNAKAFWKTYFKPYSNKWDSEFAKKYKKQFIAL